MSEDWEDVYDENDLRCQIPSSGLPLFQHQVTGLLVAASNKILSQTDKLYNDLLCSHQKEIENLQTTLETLEDELDKSDEKSTLTKYFYKWRILNIECKREKQLIKIADDFYKKRLMKRMFSQWTRVVQQNWKKQLELKIFMDVYRKQRSIVDSYEKKINLLSENAAEASEHLKSLHRSFEDSLQMAFKQNFSSNKEKDEDDLSYGYVDPTEYCDECASYCEKNPDCTIASPISFTNYKYKNPIPVSSGRKKHASALPKRIPVMGTYGQHAQQKFSTITLCPDTNQTIIVEKYIPVAQPNVSSSVFRTSNYKSRNQKKFV